MIIQIKQIKRFIELLAIGLGVFTVMSLGALIMLFIISNQLQTELKEKEVITQPINTINTIITPIAQDWPTGYDIWNEVNRYRISQGKEEMILDERFCNNIAARALNYEKTNSHDGLNQFVENYIYPLGVKSSISEVLNRGNSTQQIIQGWINSPSHNLLILKHSRGCAYSSRGYSVVLMGY